MSPVNNILRLPGGIKNVFFSSTLRIFLGFFLHVSSFTCFILILLEYQWDTVAILAIVLNGVLFFHHCFVMIRCKALRNKPPFGSLVDFILVAAECTAVLYMMRPWTWRIHRYYFTDSIILTCAVWVEAVCLCLLLMIRFAVIVTNLIREPSTALTKPFDFFAMTKDEKTIDQMINRLHSGSSFSHARSWFLFLLKSICIFVILFLLLVSMFTNLVLEPIRETGVTPVKLYTAKYNPDPLNVDDIHWNIIAFDEWGEGSAKLSDAIQVNSLSVKESDTNPPCDLKSGPRATEILGWKSIVESMEVYCPWHIGPNNTFYNPDLLITVNFTTLGIDSTSLSNYRDRTVSIVVGLHNDTVDILRNTLPIPLVPDAHLLGGVLTTIRYQYKYPKLASLGATSFTTKYITAFVPFLTPDASSQIPRDNNTATLRLYVQRDPSDWRVSIDYREKSVLSGISVIGGLWTFANGVFATIFGTTFWWVLFGAKPLSRFGWIHNIPKFKPTLEDEVYRRRYPNLSEGQSDGGLLDYIKDNFVDLKLLKARDQVANEEPDLEKAESISVQTP